MTRYLLLATALVACTGKPQSGVDSANAALPAIDTLKPVTATDTTMVVKPSTQSPPQTQTKVQPRSEPRDSAFSPPRNLRKLDTVKRTPS